MSAHTTIVESHCTYNEFLECFDGEAEFADCVGLHFRYYPKRPQVILRRRKNRADSRGSRNFNSRPRENAVSEHIDREGAHPRGCF